MMKIKKEPEKEPDRDVDRLPENPEEPAQTLPESPEEPEKTLPESPEEAVPKKKRPFKRVLALFVTVITTAGLTLAGLFQSPTEALLRKETYTPAPYSAPADPTFTDDDEDPEKTTKRRRLKDVLRERVRRLPTAVKLFTVVPLWLLGSLLLQLFTKLGKAVLAPVLLFLLRWLAMALLLLGLLYLLLKLIFPDFRFRELLNAGTLLTLVIGTGLISLLDLILPRVWESFDSFRLLYYFAGGLIVLFAAAFPAALKHRKNKNTEQAA